MDTWDYKPERKADWGDIAEAIRASVTMEEAVRTYAPEHPPRRHRIPCPFHNGRDYNLSYSTNGYKCFVCGASGDVIGFVKDICECSTRSDAMKRINQDFNLHLPIDSSIDIEFSVELQKRREAARKKEAEKKAWEDKYHRLMDEWISLDKFLRSANPDTPELAEDLAKAQARIVQVDYELGTMGGCPA